MKNKISTYKKTVLIIIIGITAFSCSYKKGELQVDCPIPATISFHHDILPIFSASCSTFGCHTSSAYAGNLNLEASSAYTQLMYPGRGYIDTVNAEYSVLYNKLVTTTDRMPLNGKLDDCKISVILKWIQQGAKNN